MERKIGEIFEYNGEWYLCIKGDSCAGCDIKENCLNMSIGACSSALRTDRKQVIFKKLEKVGEPITVKGGTFQKLIFDNCICANCVFNVQNKECYKNSYIDAPCYDSEIWVEIKQTKEDMEEDKLNLKPFDIQKAKDGKPVCTRDGRQARIICFDRKDIKPIVALVTVVNDTSVTEKALYYFEDGHHLSKYDNNINDLVMLPEKKEGWVNVRRLNSPGDNDFPYVSTLYPTKEEAITNANLDVIDTIKISWKE